MKFLWFFIVALLVVFGFLRERETKAPPVSEIASMLPAPSAGILPGAAVLPLPSTPQQDEDGPRLQKIAGMARFALPTQEKRLALEEALDDPDLAASLPRILTAGDAQPFDLDQEKLRMNAVAVLGLILQHRDNHQREDLLQFMQQRILSADFDRMPDIRVKQSVYGDITEMLVLLKQADPEAFEDVARRINESNRKVLKTALAASRSSI